MPGYPVAYRRSAPVRYTRGIQSVERRALSKAARYAARNAVKSAARTGAIDAVETTAVAVAERSAIRAVLPMLGVLGVALLFGLTLYELYKILNPGVSGAPGEATFGDYERCPTPATCGSITGWAGHAEGGNPTCNTVGDCGNSGLGGYSFPIDHWYDRMNFFGPLDTGGKGLQSQWILPGGGAEQPGFEYGPQPASAPPQLLPSPNLDPWNEPIPSYPPLDPQYQPITQPVPEYEPLPVRVLPRVRPSPQQSPTEQTWRGPLRDPSGWPYPWLNPDVEIAPGVQEGTVGEPGPTLTTGPAGAPMTQSPPASGSSARPRPPGRGTKERKAVLAVGGGVARLANIVSESRDVVVAIYGALPKKYRSRLQRGRRTRTMQAMLRDLYRHWDKVDLPQAVYNLIINEVQDRAYGKLGQALKRGKQAAHAAGYDTTAHGYQLGGRYRPSYRTGGGGGPPLPHFDLNDVLRSVGWR